MSINDLKPYALAAVRRGWYILPCGIKGKEPTTIHGLKDAVNDPADVEQYWTKYPRDNVAINCGESGLVVMDVDAGFTCLEEFEAWRERSGILRTYTVRSGRRLNPVDPMLSSFACHMYYKGAIPGLGNKWFELDGAIGQFRSEGGYVLAAGSVHDKSAQQYYPVYGDEEPLTPITERMAALFLKSCRAARAATDAKVTAGERIPTGSRHDTLLRYAAKMVLAGTRNPDILLAAVRDLRDRCCDRPEEKLDDELRNIVLYALEHPLEPTPERRVFLGSERGGVPAPASGSPVPPNGTGPAPESAAPGFARPDIKYPIEYWEGTLYGDYAKLATEGNFIPPAFFVESLKTCVGAILGDTVYIPKLAGGDPRSFELLLGTPQSGKNTCIDWTLDLFSGKPYPEEPLTTDAREEFLTLALGKRNGK
jgi:hypothetical protein